MLKLVGLKNLSSVLIIKILKLITENLKKNLFAFGQNVNLNFEKLICYDSCKGRMVFSFI